MAEGDKLTPLEERTNITQQAADGLQWMVDRMREGLIRVDGFSEVKHNFNDDGVVTHRITLDITMLQ